MTPISLPLAELKTGLSGLGKILNPRSTLPVLQSVRLERTPEGWVCLSATDLDRFVTLRLEQPAKGEPFALLVPFDELSRLAKSCSKDERLEVQPGDDGVAIIHFTLGSQSGQTKVQSLPVEQFPVIPEIVTGKGLPVSEDLRTALHEAFACCSSDAARPALHGALLDVIRPKAHYVVGTDGRHLYCCNSFRLPFAHPVIIPKHRFLAWREFNLDGPWQMKLSDSADTKAPPWVQLSSRRWRFVTRLIEGPYPDWRVVMPDSKPRIAMELDASSMNATLQTLERLPCHDERYHPLGLEWKDNGLFFLGKARPEDPWTRIPINTSAGKGPDLTVSVDRQYALKALSFGLTTLELNDEISPLRFSRGGRQMIIMPLRNDAHGRATDPSPATPGPSASASSASAHTSLSSTLTPREAEPTPSAPMHHHEDKTKNSDSRHAARAADPASEATPPGERAERSALEAALVRVEHLKTGWREAIAELSKLSEILKQALRDQRMSQRETQTMRSTLRSLQSLSI